MTAPQDPRAGPLPPQGWEYEVPRYRATCDLWPASKAHFKTVRPVPGLADVEDIWQYGRRFIAAGEVITTIDWPHVSFRPINESARRVHAYFLARNRSWLPIRPWDDGHVVLTDGVMPK